MSDMKPTPEDLARDAVADMAVANAATPGPWVPFQPADDDTWWWVWQKSKLPYYGGVADLSIGNSSEPGAIAHACIEDADVESEQEKRDAAFIALSRTALPAWIRRAIAAEEKSARLHDLIDNYDTISPCACCGKKLAWVFAGDGTFAIEVDTGNTHSCPVGSDDFRAGKFPVGTARYHEHRAINAEAEVARLRNIIRLASNGEPDALYAEARKLEDTE